MTSTNNRTSAAETVTKWLLGSGAPGLLRFAALLFFTFFLLVINARIGVLLHEFGHAAACAASGGEVIGIDIKLFGGGWCRCDGGRSSAFQVAGIIVNAVLGLVTAAAAIVMIRRNSKMTWLIFALGLGAVINFAGATHYATLSSFYGYGDVHNWPRFWIVGLIAFIMAMPAGLLLWSRALTLFAGPLARAIPARLLTAFVPMLLYGGCLLLEQRLSSDRTQFAALRAEEVAVAREIEQLKERKLEEWRCGNPEQEAPPEVIEVSPDEVPRPFPLLATVLLLDVVFLIAALIFVRHMTKADDTHGVPHIPLPGAIAAAAAALLIAWLAF